MYAGNSQECIAFHRYSDVNYLILSSKETSWNYLSMFKFAQPKLRQVQRNLSGGFRFLGTLKVQDGGDSLVIMVVSNNFTVDRVRLSCLQHYCSTGNFTLFKFDLAFILTQSLVPQVALFKATLENLSLIAGSKQI